MPIDAVAEENWTFAERLRAGMTHAGYDSRGGKVAFAERYGVKAPVVTDWRKGRYMPDHAKAKLMAAEFGCSVDWLYYGEGEAPKWFGASVAKVKTFTKERRAVDDVTAVQMALESLTLAVCSTQQGATAAFLADLKATAKAQGFSLKYGLLAKLVGIASKAPYTSEVVAPARQRGGSVRPPKL